MKGGLGIICNLPRQLGLGLVIDKAACIEDGTGKEGPFKHFLTLTKCYNNSSCRCVTVVTLSISFVAQLLIPLFYTSSIKESVGFEYECKKGPEATINVRQDGRAV